MKKSIWIFLLSVLLPSAVLGWLALRSAEEQQIIFERRTAELYQKETEALAVTVRDAVEAERRVFGETVHRLLANGDAEALARDFTNTLADAWPRKAIGFVLNKDGKLVSPTTVAAAKNPAWGNFLVGNGSFLCSSEPAMVYTFNNDNNFRGQTLNPRSKSMSNIGNLAQTGRSDEERFKNKVNEGTQAFGNELAKSGINAPPPKESPAGEAKPSPTLALRTEGHGGDFSKAPQAGGKAAADKMEKPNSSSLQVLSPAAPAAAAPMPAKKATIASKADAPTDGSGSIGSGELKSALARTLPSVQMPAPTPSAQTATLEKGTVEPATARTDPDRQRATAVKAMTETQGTAPGVATKSKSAPMPTAPPMPQPVSSREPEAVAKDGKDQQQGIADAIIEPYGKLGLNRQVEPQQLLGAPSNALSMITPATAEFRTLTEEGDDGIVSRFVQNKLDLIFWLRPPEAPEMVFGCLVEAVDFSELWQGVLERHTEPSPGSREGSAEKPTYVMALLDDRGHPAATRPAGPSVRDWKRPFVASEIGEALPHWEAALYLASPTALADSARGLWRTLAFTIAGAVALIALGGWLVVADARRQLALAQQKTDFVSNVSHELKTPLTSIRMFAELMHDRPQPAEKQGQYLRIITVEAERLTRLINNVLDFAKMGRKQKQFEKMPLDLHEVISRTWESQGLHLREAGFAARWEAAPGPYPILGDEDALAQVLVNLLSNAEKYSTDRKEVNLHTWLDDGWVNVSVIDCGMGVPNGEERKIFEAFYRAHDSLSSGIQGSGLGLTLAQRVAREHGGEIKFERREGGGSRFTLRLPLAGKVES